MMRDKVESAMQSSGFGNEETRIHSGSERATGAWQSHMVHIEDASGYVDHDDDEARSDALDRIHCWL